MPVTPHFAVTQDDTAVVVTIKVPHVRVSEVEVLLEGVDFSFYCKPYLLNLRFEGALQQDDSCKAQYLPDVDDGTIVATLPKLNHGEVFPDLDLQTALLRPMSGYVGEAVRQPSAAAAPSIEVLSSESAEGYDEPCGDGDGTAAAMAALALGGAAATSDGEGGGAVTDELDTDILLVRPKYGFNRRYSGFFTDLRDDLHGTMQLHDPEGVSERKRDELCRSAEAVAFDADRYHADEYYADEDPIFIESMTFRAHWETDHAGSKEPFATPAVATMMAVASPSEVDDSQAATPDAAEPYVAVEQRASGMGSGNGGSGEDGGGGGGGEPGLSELSSGSGTAVAGAFWTEAETEQMRQFRNKEFLISPAELPAIWGGLVSILVGYVYDNRTTCGDTSVESPWTICTLSATLSWLQDFTGVGPALVSGVRRCLVYPYIRNWALATKVAQDVCCIFGNGRRCILRCLLQVHAVLAGSEMYLLNKLFIQDYIVWIQTVPEALVQQAAAALDGVFSSISRADVGLELGSVAQGEESEEEESEEEESEPGSDEEEEDLRMPQPLHDDASGAALVVNTRTAEAATNASAPLSPPPPPQEAPTRKLIEELP